MEKVVILMSTYNGEKYLEEQLESLFLQEEVEISILVRDDGSSDNTVKILNKYQAEGRLSWYTGNNLKSARSFLNLIQKAPKSNYYAFCDQDDVWNSDKLKRAIHQLERVTNTPKLYCSNYQLVDKNLNHLTDNGHVSTVSFKAALVASNCTGCTVVFDSTLLKLIRKQTPEHLVMHDDWAHKVCLAVGGTVIYDENKSLLYRQHEKNVDGGLRDVKSRLLQIKKRIQSQTYVRSLQINELIKIYSDLMSKDNYEMAKLVANYRDNRLVTFIKLILNNKIRSPNSKSNRGFKLAILFKYF
ncbi:glycosyltransferase [Enterococcus avium]|uniref:glycosyltransferase n=1 Tax=Enterococcus avium TaxID=33945 RepID=UPI00288E08C0|nr:glycosyltransferase [Enterococcus avium]MDT2459462.1 glycosyltransferase [Enterococcus avium]